MLFKSKLLFKNYRFSCWFLTFLNDLSCNHISLQFKHIAKWWLDKKLMTSHQITGIISGHWITIQVSQRCIKFPQVMTLQVKREYFSLKMLHIRYLFLFAIVSFVFIGSRRSMEKHNYHKLFVLTSLWIVNCNWKIFFGFAMNMFQV